MSLSNNTPVSSMQFNESLTIDRAASIRHFLQPLSQWLLDSKITEIAINRPGEVWYESATGWEKHSLVELNFQMLIALGTAVAKYSNNEFSDNHPILSAVLPDGERIQIVRPPACEAQTVSITIRKPSHNIKTLAQYELDGFFKHIKPISESLTDDEKDLLKLKDEKRYIEFIRKAVQLEKVIVVAGETGSGKTTFMKALMQEINPNHRIITIEDVPELFLPHHPNHVHLFYPSEVKEEDNTPVTAASLLKSCLRMKPTRILLAELRGAEAFDFINVAASGHGGSITSCHAGSAELTFERMTLMILQNRQGRTLPHDVIRRLLYMTIDVVIHVHNDIYGNHGRHITELWYEPELKRNR